MATWNDTLNRLFSQKIVIKKMPGGRIKTFDYNKIQTFNSDSMANYKRIKRGDVPGTFHGYANTSDAEAIEALRQQLYLEYSLMDTDPILASALDIYSDSASATNEAGYILTIKSDNPKIKKILYNLFYDILNIEFNLWSWIRTTCKFGDFMLFLEIEPSVGVINVVPIHPGFLRRNDYGGETKDKTEFTYEGPVGRSLDKNKFQMYEIAHFRLLSDTDFIPYGKSMLDGARKVFKQLVLVEDAMLLHRIMRAPEKRIFNIDVGNIPPESIDAYIEKIANEMKKVPLFDDYGNYNLRYNLMNMLEDIYLPQRNGESGTKVETLEGLKNEGAIDDIEYLRDKMMAYLKIPKAFLGYSEMGNVKTSLASEDIRFAGTIERIQKVFNSELAKIAATHLFIQGFRGADLIDFELTLSPPSMIRQRQKVDLMNEQVNLAQNIIENKIFSRRKIYEEIFEMSEVEWKAEIEQISADLKEQFRFDQIEKEGNDPKESGKSFGTAHDIASMHMASKFEADNSGRGETVKKLYTPDERHENEGRPEKPGSFGRHKDKAYGLDPFGEKELSRTGRSVESITKQIPGNLLRTTDKNVDKLFEETSNLDNINMLNEQILEPKDV